MVAMISEQISYNKMGLWTPLFASNRQSSDDKEKVPLRRHNAEKLYLILRIEMNIYQ